MSEIDNSRILKLVSQRYYKIGCLDGTYMITEGAPTLNNPVVKSGLTEVEADAWLKLLKED